MFDEFMQAQERLLQNVTFTPADDSPFGPGADAIYVCPDHDNTVIPCRACMYGTPAKTPYRKLR